MYRSTETVARRPSAPRTSSDIMLTSVQTSIKSSLFCHTGIKPVQRSWIFGKDIATMRRHRAFICLLFWYYNHVAESLSLPAKDNSVSSPSRSVSRRQAAQIVIGLAGSYVWVRLAESMLGVRGLHYPIDHETRIESTVDTALLAAAAANTASPQRPLRVLEVGAGFDNRLLRRGLYDKAFLDLSQSSQSPRKVELIALDPLSPPQTVLDDSQRKAEEAPIPVAFQFIQNSITSKLDYPDGYFDSVLCCLTLCSVSDQLVALQEIKRLVSPKGGTFGYIEHVAVNPDEPYRLLEFEQRYMDPLQQAVADNCHLHRFTQESIKQVFFQSSGDKSGAIELANQRFYVENMWPVNCQCCGVIQRAA